MACVSKDSKLKVLGCPASCEGATTRLQVQTVEAQAAVLYLDTSQSLLQLLSAMHHLNHVVMIRVTQIEWFHLCTTTTLHHPPARTLEPQD